MIKAAATLRTFGHFIKAATVRKLPKIPMIMISKVITAANVSIDDENLKMEIDKEIEINELNTYEA